MKRKSKRKSKKKSIKKTRSSPKVSRVKIGPLLGIMYERGGERYLHKFTSNRPTLETNTAGNQIFISGGKYLWTPLGVK